MKFLLTLGACFFLVFGAFLTPAFALEKGNCVCYCKTEEGADYHGEKASPALCSTSCKQEEVRMLGCYTDVTMSPEYSRLCYTKEQCEADTETNPKGEKIPSVWGGQESTCLPGRGHCYAPQGAGKYSTRLSVPIAGLTEVTDIGTYIVAIYQWLIGLGAFICVIVFTIAGFRWLLAGGNEGSISGAKEMMTNAILGMVLLLSAVAIGTLIDPRTMEIGALKTPKLAPVDLALKDDCDAWIRIGIEVGQVSGSGNCGSRGIAVSTDGVPNNLASQVRVNDVCMFRHCENNFEYCAPTIDSPEEYSCQRCSEQYTVPFDTQVGTAGVGASVETSTQVPSSQCGLIETAMRDDANAAQGARQHLYCQYFNPPSIAVGSQARGCYEITYPNTVNDYTLSCDLLRNRASEEGAVGCRAYDLAYATTGYLREQFSYQVDDLSGDNFAFPLLDRVCSDDPCGFAPPGETCDTYIASAEVSEEICGGTLGWLFGVCEEFLVNSGRADCVNSEYANDMRNISNIINDVDVSWSPSRIVNALTENGLEIWHRSKISVTDENGQPMEYKVLW